MECGFKAGDAPESCRGGDAPVEEAQAPDLVATNKPTDRRDGVFIDEPETFIAAFRKSKGTRIEAEFFHAGSRILVFPTAGSR